MQAELAKHSEEMLKGTKNAQGEQLYCTVPFRFVGIASEAIKPCTWLYQYVGENVVDPVTNEKTLKEVWLGPEFDVARKQIKEGSYKSCNLKFCPQYHGERKFMLTEEEIRLSFPEIHAYLQGEEFRGMPEEINLSYETSCNLACPSCNIHLLPVISPEKKQKLIEGLSTISSEAKEIFVAGMGDPFVSPSYRNFLRNFKADKYPSLERIVLQTNALLWNEKNWRVLSEEVRQFVKIAVISIDGAVQDTYELNRKNGKFEVLLENLDFIRKLREDGPLRELKVTYVYQENNFREIPQFLDIAQKYKIDSVLFCRISNWSMTPEEFKKRDVAEASHPLHGELLKVLEQMKGHPYKGKVFYTMG